MTMIKVMYYNYIQAELTSCGPNVFPVRKLATLNVGSRMGLSLIKTILPVTGRNINNILCESLHEAGIVG